MKFRTQIQAELFMKWINFWIPRKLKKEGKHLLKNNSFVRKNFLSCGTYDNDNRWTVFKQFITQEQIDDIRDFNGLDLSALEHEYIVNEERKRKFDYMLDDNPEPTPESELAKKISENIKNNLKKYRDDRDKS